jgi:hypothetical protein
MRVAFGGAPEWLEKVIAANSLLHSIEQRRLPDFVLQSVFVPMVTVNASSKVELSTEDFDASGEVLIRNASVPGASMLRFYIEHSQLVPGDLLELLDGAGAVVASITSKGSLLEKRIKDIHALVRKNSAAEGGRNKIQKVGAYTWEDLSEGDIVVRGPDWAWGDSDGGPGRTGTVVSTNYTWGDRVVPGGAVKVKWATTGIETLYKYDGRSREVVRLQKKIASGLESDGSLQVPGSALTLRITLSKSPETQLKRRLSFVVLPVLSLQTCLAQKENEPHLKYLRKLYISKALEGDCALVRHIEGVAAAKKMSMYDLIKKPWAQLAPTAEDLTRSPALKVGRILLFANSALIQRHLLLPRYRPCVRRKSSPLHSRPSTRLLCRMALAQEHFQT